MAEGAPSHQAKEEGNAESVSVCFYCRKNIGSWVRGLSGTLYPWGSSFHSGSSPPVGRIRSDHTEWQNETPPARPHLRHSSGIVHKVPTPRPSITMFLSLAVVRGERETSRSCRQMPTFHVPPSGAPLLWSLPLGQVRGNPSEDPHCAPGARGLGKCSVRDRGPKCFDSALLMVFNQGLQGIFKKERFGLSCHR